MNNILFFLIHRRGADGSPALSPGRIELIVVYCESAVIRLLLVLLAYRSQLDA